MTIVTAITIQIMITMSSSLQHNKNNVINVILIKQIDIALSDENRVFEKSRLTWEDSKRLDKNSTYSTDNGDAGEKNCTLYIVFSLLLYKTGFVYYDGCYRVCENCYGYNNDLNSLAVSSIK